MHQWLFVSAGGQQIGAHEPEVPGLVQSGQVGPQTLMWRDGMAQWMPAASVFPALFAAPAAVSAAKTQAMTTGVAAVASMPLTSGSLMTRPDPALIRRLAAPLLARRGWIKFFAILSIIGGVFSIFAGVGLLLIFAGVALFRVPGQLERAQASGDPAALEEVNKDISKYFLLHGIFLLIYLALILVMAVVFALGLGAGLFGALKQSGSSSGSSRAPADAPLTSDDIRFPDAAAPTTQ